MFIDENNMPEYRMQFNIANDHTDVPDNSIWALPALWPPRTHQYIAGNRYFLVRDRCNGYLVAAFRIEQVRACLREQPVHWEVECIAANLRIDESQGRERDSSAFWIFYLPFLSEPTYIHERIDYGAVIKYELRDEGSLVFDTDISECTDLWRNVRTDQWSGAAQRRVAQFLDHATSPHGWNESGRTPPGHRYTPSPIPSPHPATPTLPPPASPVDYRPATPTDDDDMGEFINWTGADVQAAIPDDSSDISDTSTRVDGDSDDYSNRGFGSDISDVEDNLDNYFITYYVDPRAQQQQSYNSDDYGNEQAEFEWRSRPVSEEGAVEARPPSPDYITIPYDGTPEPEATYQLRNWNETSSEQCNQEEDQNQSEPICQEEEEVIQPYTIGDGRNTADQSTLRFTYNNRVVSYAICNGRPMFLGPNQAKNEWHYRLWESGELQLLDTRQPIPCSDPRYEYWGDDSSVASTRCTTPDIYDDGQWD